MKYLTNALLILTSITQIQAKSIDVQGHRGARAVLPENTLPAFQHAIKLGVDTLEFDMGVTKDGVVVVMHDQKINTDICQYMNGSPISGDSWLHSMTLAEIKEIDCGSKRNPRFENQQPVPETEIPTLAEVFDLVTSSELPNAKTVLFNIETKSDPNNPDAQPEPKEFVALVLDVIKQYKLESRVTLQSFDHRTLIAAKELAPQVRLSALFGKQPEDWLAAADAAEADIVSPHYKLINSKDVKEMQEAGLAVIPWTANSKRQWARLIKMGVDGIITDDPEPLLEYLERR